MAIRRSGADSNDFRVKKAEEAVADTMLAAALG